MIHITNLLDLLYSSKELTAGMMVRSQLVKELEVYGFIPYTENANLVPLDLRLGIVASDRFAFSTKRFSRESNLAPQKEFIVLPIYRKLLSDNIEHDLLLEKLYVYSLRTNYYYKEFRNKKQLNLQQLKKASPQIFIDDGQNIHYKTLPEEILMYKKTTYPISSVSAVATSFLVICRFINSVTGQISYAIYSPEDLFPLSK